MAQYFIGQSLVLLERLPEAVGPLHEALEHATAIENEELVKAVQEVLTVAVQLAE